MRRPAPPAEGAAAPAVTAHGPVAAGFADPIVGESRRGLHEDAGLLAVCDGEFYNAAELASLSGVPAEAGEAALLAGLTIAGEALSIPANMIRFRSDRRGGDLDRVNLLLHWPTLAGFSEEYADDFKDTSTDAPLIYVTISKRETDLDSTGRLTSVYEQFFDGPVVPGPAGLVGRSMKADSPYAGEVVFFTPRGVAPFAARCLATATREIPSTCIREVNIGHGLTMLYRFNRTRLENWSRLDAGVYALATGFLEP